MPLWKKEIFQRHHGNLFHYFRGMMFFLERKKIHNKWQLSPNEKHILGMCLCSRSYSSEVEWPWTFLLCATLAPWICFSDLHWETLYTLVCYSAFCLSYTSLKQKALWVSLIFSHGIFILPTSIHSLYTLCPPPLSLPPETLMLISTRSNSKWLPTRQKEILFLCTDSLQTDGPITLAYNKSQQGVHCHAVILGVCASGGWESS